MSIFDHTDEHFRSPILVGRTDVRYRTDRVLTSPSLPDRFDDLATPLCDVTFVVLDLETTGTSPDLDEITEVGAVKYRGGECLGVFDTLVNPGMPIPPFITVLTGITEAMVLPAPRIDEVLPALLEFIGGGVIVGHNIRFDIGFLDAALLRRGGARLENPRADTLGMSRRLLHDEVDDLKLGTLARHLRVNVEPCHRALADADATAEVFHALLERAGTFGVLALDDLIALPKIRMHPSTNKLRLTARLPRRPGVYRFRDRTGAVLYVGRATNLRTSVRSHFRGDRRKVPQLLCETETIDWIECTDELEASVREARLIREHEPRFNRQGKGWRGYAYLKLTLNERFPRLAVVHTARDDGALYVGPLASFAAVTALRSAIEAAVPVRRCSTRIGARPDAAGDEPCTAADGLIECPCRGHGSEPEYQSIVDAVVRGLQGEPEVLLDLITARMDNLVAEAEFEAAARARDQRATLAGVLRHHRLLSWLRTSGTLRFLTEWGVIELDNGRLALEDTSERATDRPHAPAVEREGLDELLVVARWIKRELAAGRARVAEPTTAVPPELVELAG
jgi:DNA polymerase-3 subunit epsilon